LPIQALHLDASGVANGMDKTVVEHKGTRGWKVTPFGCHSDLIRRAMLRDVPVVRERELRWAQAACANGSGATAGLLATAIDPHGEPAEFTIDTAILIAAEFVCSLNR
jgi:hypothetical protein